MPQTLAAAIAARQAATAALERLSESLRTDDSHDGHQAVTVAPTAA